MSYFVSGVRAWQLAGDFIPFFSFSRREQAVLTASSTGRSDPLYSADINKAVGPRPALLVYTFFLEEGFSPARDRCKLLARAPIPSA